ncbi:MAG: SpoIIE family protein phosphatase [Myxococcales bacterium]|nr:SpoIIE family protein phosphatase [Myxococcales bacterium]
MTASLPADAATVEWAVAGAALAGEAESGDLHLVATHPDGVLLALIDGLGHGPEAALASRIAAALLAEHAGEPPISLVRRCHEGLRRTRGVVMSLASVDPGQSRVTWVGVGNVEGALLRPHAGVVETIVLRGGVVGYQLPALRPEALSIRRGDTLVFVTDGVRADFRSGFPLERGPQEIADTILARHQKSTDDACVLVARYAPPAAATVPVRDESDIAMARKRVRELGTREGLPAADVEALATAVTEIARNILVYAGSGEVRIAAVTDGSRDGVVVVAADQGPGIPDVELALRDGYTTGGGLGLGLGGARRLVNEFNIVSRVGEGTRVAITKWK